MNLIHFSDKPIQSVYSVKQGKDAYFKPKGLWVSDEDGHGWLAWRTEENWGLNPNEHQYKVLLSKNADILYLRTIKSIQEFTNKYLDIDYFHKIFKDFKPSFISSMYINWQKVADKYQGIIITPYQWKCRYDSTVEWYYGWDCASGCIWDKGAIESIEQIKKHERQLA